jgi:hypothetical protein
VQAVPDVRVPPPRGQRVDDDHGPVRGPRGLPSVRRAADRVKPSMFLIAGSERYVVVESDLRPIVSAKRRRCRGRPWRGRYLSASYSRSG